MPMTIVLPVAVPVVAVDPPAVAADALVVALDPLVVALDEELVLPQAASREVPVRTAATTATGLRREVLGRPAGSDLRENMTIRLFSPIRDHSTR